ncbi:unnamed protein product [Trifolium pratense]|uniref:Uncharacterized protein n=1 Tax=Trifolium pratense TaxID=57577 RepID=A0ACB0KBQ0_TRIPR|nr:unnamed protein product [Trifolium pratense]
MNCSYGANPNQAFPQDQHFEDHLESLEDTLILSIKMTQGNFEVMKANQEVSSERHEAFIKNLENQMGQLARQVSYLQTQSGFCGNTTDPRNESCNSINLRSREVSSPEVVENPKKDESKNGVVEKMRDGVVENRRENKKEEKNKEEKAYEGSMFGNMDKEGGLVSRPPLLVGASNYDYWKSRMMAFLKSMDSKTWKAVLKGWDLLVIVDKDGKPTLEVKA